MPSTGSRRDQDGFACVAREQVGQDDDGGNAMFKSQNVSVAHGKGARGGGGTAPHEAAMRGENRCFIRS